MRKYQSYFHVDQSGRKKRYEGSQTWIGLHPQVLQTPYSEILTIFQTIKRFKPESIVDIGAGYGRLGIVSSSFFPEASFTGFEIIEQRLEEAKRMFEELELGNCKMVQEDLSLESFTPPKADVYFIYDFSDPLDIRKILRQICEVNAGRETLVVAKGEFIQPIIKKTHPEFISVFPGSTKRAWDIFQL